MGSGGGGGGGGGAMPVESMKFWLSCTALVHECKCGLVIFGSQVSSFITLHVSKRYNTHPITSEVSNGPDRNPNEKLETWSASGVLLDLVTSSLQRETTRSSLRSNFQNFPGGACPQTP